MKATRFFWLILLGTACAFGGSALYVVQKDLEPQVQAVTALVEKEEACPPAQDCVMRDADSEKIIESIKHRLSELNISKFLIFHPSAQYEYKVYSEKLRNELFYLMSQSNIKIIKISQKFFYFFF